MWAPETATPSTSSLLFVRLMSEPSKYIVQAQVVVGPKVPTQRRMSSSRGVGEIGVPVPVGAGDPTVEISRLPSGKISKASTSSSLLVSRPTSEPSKYILHAPASYLTISSSWMAPSVGTVV